MVRLNHTIRIVPSMTQLTLRDADFAAKGKTTRTPRSAAEMEQVLT